MVLTDDVLVRRAAYAGKPESTLRTEQTVINAERMESDNIIGEVRLQGQVRGTLYRNAPTPKP